MKDSLNIVFVSDHGMTEINSDRTINVEKILAGLDYKLGGSRPLAMIEPNTNDYDSVYSRLKGSQDHFKVYTKENMPEYYFFNKNENIYSLLLVADLGWSIVDDKQILNMSKYDSKGNHGFENNNIDMHGIFVGVGPNFKEGFKTGSLWNIDIYPLLCKIFSIAPNPNIDGKAERIEYLLK
jgi:ectonucleotide pyrophosphatase/phosphodiesterase family protein 5